MTSYLPNPSETAPPPAETTPIFDMISAIRMQSDGWMETILQEGMDANIVYLTDSDCRQQSLAEAILEYHATKRDALDIWAVKALKLLVQHGFNFDQPAASSQNYTHQPLLCWYATQGELTAVEALLEAGANIEVLDGDGDSALGCAIWCGHDEIVLLLLSHDAQVSQCSRLVLKSIKSGTLKYPDTVVALKQAEAEQERAQLEAKTGDALATTRMVRL